jgi:hypothetical protein
MSKLTFTERKALLQLSRNQFLSAVAMKSKRATALLTRLTEKGFLKYDPEDDPFCAYLTNKGRAEIGVPLVEEDDDD